MSYFNFALELAKKDEGQRYVDKATTCCERHSNLLPLGCNQGRNCPLRAFTKEAQDELWGQIESTLEKETSCKQ